MPHPARFPFPLLALATVAVSASTFAAEPARLPRENLLVYRATSGAAVPVRNQGDWQRRRTDLVRGMEAVMGPFPGAAPAKSVDLDVRVEEEIDRDTYVIRRISYQSEPGSRTPAYLCVPKAALAALIQGLGPQ